MARPLRIEFAGAWYHVMNRGAGRRTVFREPSHFELFLALLEEIGPRFGVEIHAYCLMGNHYHLLAHTPDGGLGRGMRHLDGLYTQRLNRLSGGDGPLFRGRYKAIVVDADSYLTQVSRYIHRNPLGLVRRLTQYRWSSYPAYVGTGRGPDWLVRDRVMEAVGGGRDGYRRFVEAEVGDDPVALALERGRVDPVLGNPAFRAKLAKRFANPGRELPQARRIQAAVPLSRIVQAAADEFRMSPRDLTAGTRPRGDRTLARDLALWLGQVEGRLSLPEMASAFGLGHYTSVSTAIARVRLRSSEDARFAARADRARRRASGNT
jgi:REP element-mobilizing transposase RayT